MKFFLFCLVLLLGTGPCHAQLNLGSAAALSILASGTGAGQFDRCYMVDENFLLLVNSVTSSSGSNVDMGIYVTDPTWTTGTSGWAAVGFNTQNTMIGADVVFVSTPGHVLDFFVNQTKSVCGADGSGVCSDVALGGTNDVFSTTVSAISGQILSRFSKERFTVNPFDLGLESATHTLFSVGAQNDQGPIPDGGHTRRFVLAGSPTALATGVCPGTPACSSNGNCNRGCCMCNSGFSGRDCSVGATAAATTTTTTTTTSSSSITAVTSTSVSTTGVATVSTVATTLTTGALTTGGIPAPTCEDTCASVCAAKSPPRGVDECICSPQMRVTCAAPDSKLDGDDINASSLVSFSAMAVVGTLILLVL